MVLNIHGNAISTCTARVILSCLAMGLEPEKDFRLISEEFSELSKPDWIAHQPFAQMPWLEDTETGIELFESRAIVSYIAAKLKSPLAPGPDDLAAFAKYQQAAQNEVGQFDGPAAALAWQLYFGKWYGVTPDEEVITKQKTTLGNKLEGYERILSKQAYLGGDKLTVADLSHLPYGSLLSNIPPQRH